MSALEAVVREAQAGWADCVAKLAASEKARLLAEARAEAFSGLAETYGAEVERLHAELRRRDERIGDLEDALDEAIGCARGTLRPGYDREEVLRGAEAVLAKEVAS